MRLFSITVFDGVVAGTTERFSSVEFNAWLARADVLRFQMVVSDSSGTTPKLTVKYYTSGDGVLWDPRATLMNQVDVTSLPFAGFGVFGSPSDPNGANGRVGLVMDTASNKANVKVIATGRSY